MPLIRWIPLLAIGSVATLVAPGSGKDTPDLSARLAVILRELPQADSVLVERAWMAPRRAGGERHDLPPRAAPEKDIPIEVGRPGTDWTARFAKTLEAGRLDPDRPCVSSWTPNDSTSRLVVWVKAHHQGRIRHFQIRFEERCALISDKPFGASLDISSVAQPLLDLAREALPRDSLLRKAPLPPHVPASPVSLDSSIVVAPPPANEPPKFGEYVYVEELPEAVQRTRPVLPQAARAAGVSGTVLVQALVGKDGLVKDVKVVKSIPMLDAAAIDCVRGWKFKPALSRGDPVEVWVAVPIRFASE